MAPTQLGLMSSFRAITGCTVVPKFLLKRSSRIQISFQEIDVKLRPPSPPSPEEIAELARKSHNGLPRLGPIEFVPPSQVRPYPGTARKHPRRKLKALSRNLTEFGILAPIIVDDNYVVIDGHALVEVAKRLNFSEIPVIRLSHLTEPQVIAIRLALNRLTENAEWDMEKVAIDLQSLIEFDYKVDLSGFEIPEADLIIENAFATVPPVAADHIPSIADDGETVCRPGDLWWLGVHRLLCGDARSKADYEHLMCGNLAEIVFTDPPYNVSIQKHAGGKGALKHAEFAMASGEMSGSDFRKFLDAIATNLILFSTDGSVHYICMDWRHAGLLETVCKSHYDRHLNTCAWVKNNAGMGSFYRSQHEFVLVFRNGDGSHLNNVQLGKYGRHRTNVWFYDGVNSIGSARREELALHPTVKPVGLVADALKDASRRGGIVLDPFLGSGTTLVAAEETGRVAYGMEYEPNYVDVAIKRWQDLTGALAVHEPTGLTFEEMSKVRTGTQLLLPPPSNTPEA
jgi:DNA modification methylase